MRNLVSGLPADEALERIRAMGAQALRQCDQIERDAASTSPAGEASRTTVEFLNERRAEIRAAMERAERWIRTRASLSQFHQSLGEAPPPKQQLH